MCLYIQKGTMHIYYTNLFAEEMGCLCDVHILSRPKYTKLGGHLSEST